MRYWTTPVVRHTSTVELELQGENRRVTAKVLNFTQTASRQESSS